MSIVANTKSKKWELPTLSLLYNSKYDISHSDYKVYDLVNVEFYQFVSFLFKDTTPQPIKKKASISANLFSILKKDTDVNPTIHQTRRATSL